MPAFAERGATINRLRIQSRLDPLAARLRASRLLDESTLQPATLPPPAILCIRRLPDPRPGQIVLDSAKPPPPAWTEAVAASIADLARRASRPGRGDTTAGADAVIFADRAEMLACLAADWCGGRLSACWWWRALFGEAGDLRSILRAWLDTPTYIAASLDELARRGVAMTFVERLPRAETHALLDAVVVQHDLRLLVPALEPLDRPERLPTGAPRDSLAPAAAARAVDGASMAGMVPQAPWKAWAAERQLQLLRIDQQCLLGIALTTRRAPAIVRTARFAAEVRRWCEQIAGTESIAPIASDPRSDASRVDRRVDRDASVTREPDVAESLTHHAKQDGSPPAPIAQSARIGTHRVDEAGASELAPPIRADQERSLRPQWPRTGTAVGQLPDQLPSSARPFHPSTRSGSPQPVDGKGRDRRTPSPVRHDDGGATPELLDAPRNDSTGFADPIAQTIAASTPAAGSTRPVSTAAVSTPTTSRQSAISGQSPISNQSVISNQQSAIPASEATTDVARVYPASIETEVGGVFYLLNVAMRLGLYGDFTTPAQPGIDLSIWDLLTLAGRRLTPRRFRGDALWALLADLAGRAPDEPPGATFEAPDVWRVPVEWLQAFPDEGTWRSFESSGRLRIVHPAGFVVVDVPRESGKGAAAQAAQEGSTYESPLILSLSKDERRVEGDGFGRMSGTDRWLRWLMPYVRARLARALGEPDRRRAGFLLCVQRSRVVISATHVDVMFSLADLPIEVRLSGLDRNPGWIPAADRVVAFHYE